MSDAIKRGEAKGLAKVTNSLFKSANEGNVTAQIFYLKNRDVNSWADRVETSKDMKLSHLLNASRLEDSLFLYTISRVLNLLVTPPSKKVGGYNFGSYELNFFNFL